MKAIIHTKYGPPEVAQLTEINKPTPKENETPIVDYSFDILDKVALDGSWSIVYDIENMSIHFKTASNKNIKTINFSDFDFECKNQTLVYNLQKENKGQVSTYFEALTYDLNTSKMKDAMKKAKFNCLKT